MSENQTKRAKVVGVVLKTDDGRIGFAILTETEKKLLTGALIDVAGQFLQITTPNPAGIQTRGA
jgi:hypothetical protein